MKFETFLRLLRETYEDPRAMARRIMALELSTGPAYLALALVAVASTFLASLAEMLARWANPASDPGIYGSPFALTLMQLFGMMLGAGLICWGGRLFGGKGTWAQTLPLVAWLQIVFVILQAVQFALMLALPFLTLPLFFFTLFSVFFLTAHFIAALHGFHSTFRIILGMILVLFVVSFALALVLMLFLPEAALVGF